MLFRFAIIIISIHAIPYHYIFTQLELDFGVTSAARSGTRGDDVSGPFIGTLGRNISKSSVFAALADRTSPSSTYS